LIPSAVTGGSLLAAAVMHARSSTDSSCAKTQVGMSVSNTVRKRMTVRWIDLSDVAQDEAGFALFGKAQSGGKRRALGVTA
jgi:hypothetical protein